MISTTPENIYLHFSEPTQTGDYPWSPSYRKRRDKRAVVSTTQDKRRQSRGTANTINTFSHCPPYPGM